MILHGGRKLSNSTKIFTHIIKHMDEMKDCNKVEECAHFFNLNGHDKNLSSFPIEILTWVHIVESTSLIICKDLSTWTQVQPISIGSLHLQSTNWQLN
ncbi:hypothetical protein AAG906_025908 [Vitis piasezkii]